MFNTLSNSIIVQPQGGAVYVVLCCYTTEEESPVFTNGINLLASEESKQIK